MLMVKEWEAFAPRKKDIKQALFEHLQTMQTEGQSNVYCQVLWSILFLKSTTIAKKMHMHVP